MTWFILGVLLGFGLAALLVVCVGRESHERGRTLDFTSRDARGAFKHASGAFPLPVITDLSVGLERAPVGTVIRCAVCEAPIAELVRPVIRGAIIHAEDARVYDGGTYRDGDAVLCPSGLSHAGAYAIVSGEPWPINSRGLTIARGRPIA